MRKRILRVIEKNRNEVRGILFRRYPAFVWSDRAEPPSVPPVFVFHEVRRPVVEALLAFLADNAYTTLTADEYAERVGQRGRGWNREVVLTFDDGLRSLHDVVVPALESFHLKAVAYVVTGRVPEEDRPGRLLCSWKEIRGMHGSGAVDIQSHSVLHDSVAVSERVVDFVNPGTRLSFLSGDLVPAAEGVPRLEDRDDLPLGTPIHDWGTRFGERRAFRESPSAVRACLERVAGGGGPEFFRQRGWRGRLGSVVREVRRSAGDARFETGEEQGAAILGEMSESKREIEARLPGKTVRHFCFPWSRGSRLAVRLSAEAGYVTNAWGSLRPDFAADGDAPIPVERLPYCYIWRLPGKGRRSLEQVLRRRWSEILQDRYANH